MSEEIKLKKNGIMDEIIEGRKGWNEERILERCKDGKEFTS